MYEQIRSNRIRSIILELGMAALLLAVGYAIGLAFFGNGIGGLIVAILVWAALTVVAFFQGDSILLAVSRARKVTHEEYPQLFNVVEEMQIATGLPKMPDVYVIDDPAPNAFATGRDPNRAAVAVTTGLLDRLNRDELQGVIAHEMSHVVNRDVLLMTLAGVVLGAIVILSWYATRVAFFGGLGRRRGGGGGGGGSGQIIIAIIGLILVILAPIFAQLIYFAISRRREYLADASGALYTRYPEGLASALEKIGASPTQVRAVNQATAPMFIANPFRKGGAAPSGLFSTHPPIEDRIRTLRAMEGGSSLADYDKAYRELHEGRGVVPPSAVRPE
jgi:heat shock protein HtpX